MPNQCARHSAGLQLVILILSGGQARGQDGGDYQPCAIAYRCWPSGQTCRTDHAVSHAVSHVHARGKRQATRTHRQHPCGLELCQGSCRAVASGRSLEDLPRLHGGENHATFAALESPRSTHNAGLTAEFRFNRHRWSIFVRPQHIRRLSRTRLLDFRNHVRSCAAEM